MKSKSFFIFLLPLSLWLTGCLPFNKPSITNTNSTSTEVQELTFSQVKSETYTNYSSPTPRLVLIETRADWEQFWTTELEGNKLPPGPAPEIDFQTQLILAAFSGQKTSGGYSLEITGINTNTSSGSADVVIYATQQLPPSGAPTTQVITSPAQVVSVEHHANFNLEDVFLVLRTPETGDEQIVSADRSYGN